MVFLLLSSSSSLPLHSILPLCFRFISFLDRVLQFFYSGYSFVAAGTDAAKPPAASSSPSPTPSPSAPTSSSTCPHPQPTLADAVTQPPKLQADTAAPSPFAFFRPSLHPVWAPLTVSAKPDVSVAEDEAQVALHLARLRTQRDPRAGPLPTSPFANPFHFLLAKVRFSTSPAKKA
jgi:hypothetical protein